MRLILSSRHPRNSSYSTESGEILYKVTKPPRLGPRTVTIRKAVGTVQGVWQGDPDQSRPRSISASSSSASRGIRAKVPTRPGTSESMVSKMTGRNRRDSELVDVDGGGRKSPTDDEGFTDSDDEDEEEEGVEPGSPTYEGHFAFYAQIEFNALLSPRFRFDSREVSVKEYFRKEGWSWYGRSVVIIHSDDLD
ncbi:hypothetical protein NP233_g7397 [Leucocoprinus birnbaumii]|uniref:Uncharacterized protein n=1 Tax=Leucocoprinus birnbaumii TaxID=56174 RepID=A0AAD5VPD1_9AGAR|nr:hypothetical protein NP233_g7397 [Leucocoprinus birnbaumii]